MQDKTRAIYLDSLDIVIFTFCSFLFREAVCNVIKVFVRLKVGSFSPVKQRKKLDSSCKMELGFWLFGWLIRV